MRSASVVAAVEYGRALPQPLKRGIADAVRRLYGERAALKYDGMSRAWRMAGAVNAARSRGARGAGGGRDVAHNDAVDV
jgi:hypothetical protein